MTDEQTPPRDTPESVEALEDDAFAYANDESLPEPVRQFIRGLWRAYCEMEEAALRARPRKRTGATMSIQDDIFDVRRALGGWNAETDDLDAEEEMTPDLEAFDRIVEYLGRLEVEPRSVPQSGTIEGREPCPFCGSTDVHRHDFSDEETDPNAGGSCYQCHGCGASGPIVFGDKESLEWSWDRRSSPRPGTEPEDPGWAAARVMEVREEGDGWWKPCSGCQESVDGYVSTRDYPYSAMFGCQPGGGCRDCGGLGVIWERAPDEAGIAWLEAEGRSGPPRDDLAAPAVPALPLNETGTARVWPDGGIGCIGCGRRYGDEHGFPDLVIPDEAWAEISPGHGEGGLLCPSCMCRRAHERGVRCEAVFRSGPFCAPAVPAREAAQERFAEWFRKNYPGPDTIIHKPDWHAPKIFRAVLAALATGDDA